MRIDILSWTPRACATGQFFDASFAWQSILHTIFVENLALCHLNHQDSTYPPVLINAGIMCPRQKQDYAML